MHLADEPAGNWPVPRVRNSGACEQTQDPAHAGSLDRPPLACLRALACCSEDNLTQANKVTATSGTEVFIATGRTKHDDPVPASPRGRIPKGATPRQRMARKLRTKKGRAAYARSKVIVEPVGQMATLQNSKQLLLRGIGGAKGEWLLLAACHNLRKLHQKVGTDGLAALATG